VTIDHLADSGHLGAWPENAKRTQFRVWAPHARRVQVVCQNEPNSPPHDLTRNAADGTFSATLEDFPSGTRYRYLVDGTGPWPDPASRFQPEGVHGPSEVIDPRAFAWTDAAWPGLPPEDLVIYELHVGTFSPEGTFDGLRRRLRDLKDLGITAIELMPLADFPGDRGWGYDGVAWFAPARCYGRPEHLRRLVDEAHSLGMAVIIDVVYNHFGPDGNYTGCFSSDYVSPTLRNPWGPALDFTAAGTRRHVIESALCWLTEYHLDGLRLDATHALIDPSPTPILAELAEAVKRAIPHRRIHLHAEDHRNLNTMVGQGGWGLDAIWSDDFHHELRRYLRGDSRGLFQDFRGSLADLAHITSRGWLFEGAYSHYRQKPRGTDPTGLCPRQLVFFLQNHDRIANHGLGERLHDLVGLSVTRAATALMLVNPYTPLIFMGQEWAASSPFLFFTDHEPALGRLVHEGRVREYAENLIDAGLTVDPATIPNPQAEATFLACKLDHDEADEPPHSGMLQLHVDLMALRRQMPALRQNEPGRVRAIALELADTIAVRTDAADGSAVAVVARLKGSGPVAWDDLTPLLGVEPWEILWSTEEPQYAADPQPVVFEDRSVLFARPSAIVLRAGPTLSESVPSGIRRGGSGPTGADSDPTPVLPASGEGAEGESPRPCWDRLSDDREEPRRIVEDDLPPA
jgi:maltooligosyltrehalose trehalohydrolase